MRILFNAYPTMHIFHNLKNLVKLNHKEYANKGKDPYAIYNFDVKTEKGQAKWDKLRRNYAGKLSNLIGKSFKNTRHTFVSFGEDLGVPDVKLSEILGHRSTKGSLRKYKKFSIQEIDLIHLQILDDSDIINLFHTLYNSLKDKKSGFEFDTNKVTLIKKNGRSLKLPLQSKFQTANKILSELV